MAFRVEIAPQAFDDLDSIAAYIKENSSFAVAERWFNGVMGDIASLKEMPARCPVAPEAEELGQEVRILLHGRRKRTTRSITRLTTRRHPQAGSEFFTCATRPGSRSATANSRHLSMPRGRSRANERLNRDLSGRVGSEREFPQTVRAMQLVTIKAAAHTRSRLNHALRKSASPSRW